MKRDPQCKSDHPIAGWSDASYSAPHFWQVSIVAKKRLQENPSKMAQVLRMEKMGWGEIKPTSFSCEMLKNLTHNKEVMVFVFLLKMTMNEISPD